MDNVIIAAGAKEHIADIAAVTKEAFSDYAREAGIKTIDALTETIENVEWDIQNKIVFCALLSQKVIGSLRIEVDFDGKTAYLSRFGVLPAYKNIGVGKKLMEAVDDKLKGLKVQKLFLHTAANVDALMDFYKNKGFNVLSVCDKLGYPRALMVKNY